MPMPDERDSAELVARLVAHTTPAMLAWCVDQQLCRYLIQGDAHGEIVEIVAPPVLLLGPGEGDVYACPDPDVLGYPERALAAMTLADYHIFLVRYLTQAVAANIVSCLVCKRPITNDPGAPWDGIFVDQELVGWLMIHFDCKRGLAREYKGRHPFELNPKAPPHFVVSQDGATS